MGERLKSLLLILIFTFLASGLALAILSQIQTYRDSQVYLATESALPLHRAVSKTSRLFSSPDLGLSFQYPASLVLAETATSVELSHKIQFKNDGECNMKGDTAVYDYLTDFRAGFRMFTGSMAQAVRQFSPYMPAENFDGENLKYSPGFIDAFAAGKLKGYAIYEGVEGCGHTIYYFPVDNGRILVVENAMVQQLSGIASSDLEKQILAVPGAISRQRNAEIFNKILESVKFN